MTPSDIATDVSAVPGSGSLNTSTHFTQSSALGGGFTTDDANTWD